jgi:hypothetical protein
MVTADGMIVGLSRDFTVQFAAAHATDILGEFIHS